MTETYYYTRTDGQSICVGCAYYRGPYLGCMVQDTGTSMLAISCYKYVSAAQTDSEG